MKRCYQFPGNLLSRQSLLILGLASWSAIASGCASQPRATSESPTATTTVEISSTDITNYAQAVLALEPYRQTAFSEVQKLTPEGALPTLACNQSETMRTLSRDTQKVVVDYCNQAKEISSIHNLPVNTFNAISLKAQTDPALQKQLQQELLRHQQSSLLQQGASTPAPATPPTEVPTASPESQTN